jgi:hypothetical protein
MGENFLSFLLGVLSGVFGNYLFARFTTRGQSKANSKQWDRIKALLAKPRTLRSVKGDVTLLFSVNSTPWTVAVETCVYLPMDESGGMSYRLGLHEWKPNTGLMFEVVGEAKKALENPTSSVQANISYEPVHKNVGTVECMPVGEKVHIYLHDTCFLDRWGSGAEEA